MMSDPHVLRSRFNLAGASVLLVENSHQGMGVLSQVFMGFGVADTLRAYSAEEAMEAARKRMLDLVVAETSLPGEADGYDLVRELRRAKGNPNAFTPVILISGHTPFAKVRKARDCGANFVVLKPLTPRVLLERILWISRENRPFVETPHYLGPDRRFHVLDVPEDGDRRAPAQSASLEQVAA